MDKLIQSQPMQETIKICYGNDFNLSVSVNVWNADTSAWDKLDLSAASDIEMFLVAQNGKRIKTTSSLDNEGNITASIPSTYLSKTLYALEITFKQDNRNRRTYSPCMIQIVNSTDEAGQSVMDYTTNDSYHFDILVKNDIAWLNIGMLPDEYVTETELDEVLADYTTNESLATTLTSYATNSSVETQLTTLWDDANSIFVDNTELGETLLSYVTQEQLSANSYVTETFLDAQSYVTTTLLDAQSYATQQYVQDEIAQYTPDMTNYYDKSDIDTTLLTYINSGEYDSTNHLIKLKHNDTVITSIDATDFIIDGMVDNVYISNGNLVIDFNTDSGKQDITIPISDIFDANNYYTKSDIDSTLSSYVTAQALSQMTYVTSTELSNAAYVTQADLSNNSYVTQADLSNNSYVTANDVDTILSNASYVTDSQLSNCSYATEAYVSTYVDPLDIRVTYLEQHGGGGAGTGDVTYQYLSDQSYVHCYDATYIWMLTQQEYDTLANNNQLDSYTFYYIEGQSSSGGGDAITYSYLESNYVSKSYLSSQSYATEAYVTNAIAQSGGGSAPSNMVTTDTQQTITGEKTFSGNMTFDGETTFQYSSPANLYYMDIANPIYKSSMMARPAINQIITCEIIAGNVNQTNSTNGMNQEANKIKFEKVTGTFNRHHPILSQLAAIDDSGIYEGSTLLSNKYVQSSSIRNIVQISQNDYNTLVNNQTVDANTLYIIS